MTLATYQSAGLLFRIDGALATLTLNRPERKNPIKAAATDEAVKAFVARQKPVLPGA